MIPEMPKEEFKSFFNRDFSSWFNEYGKVTFDGSEDDCLIAIYNSWVMSNRKARYFWITQLGRISHENVSETPSVISVGSIHLKSGVYRNHQINKILN